MVYPCQVRMGAPGWDTRDRVPHWPDQDRGRRDPQDGVPPWIGQRSEHLPRGGWYASCLHVLGVALTLAKGNMLLTFTFNIGIFFLKLIFIVFLFVSGCTIGRQNWKLCGVPHLPPLHGSTHHLRRNVPFGV